ncbi:MAG TPA: AsmA-like C-terminal region-containing protein [Bacteroidales bacterium]|nr:AsmA-like C-terminal region-containing protein [Bacteroidales bacterium]HSA42247.1 AsmA-like C-terminal region-containing protein [Bacteroidales bacterium]
MARKRGVFSRVIKWSLISLLAAAVLITATAFLFARWYGEQIQTVFVAQLNKRLASEISVREIRFSLFRQFPYATLDFTDLTALDATVKKKKDTLLQASSLQLHFNLWQLLQKKYVIRRLDLRQASLTLRIYQDLSDNYHFWKDAGESAPNDFSLALEKVVFDRVEVRYRNAPAGQDYQFFVKNARGKGRFSDETFDMKLKGGLLTRDIRSGSQHYLRNKDLSIALDVNVNQNNGQISVSAGRVQVGKLNLEAGGGLVYSRDKKSMNLQFKAENTRLEDLYEDLPDTWTKTLKDYALKGKLQLLMKVSGKFGGASLPFIDATFSVEDASLSVKNEGISLKNLSFSGNYKNQGTSDPAMHLLQIPAIAATLGNDRIKGSVDIQGFAPVRLLCILEGETNAGELIRLLKQEKNISGDGRLGFQCLYRGLFESTDSIGLKQIMEGNLEAGLKLHQLSLELPGKGLAFTGLEGAGSFNNNDLIINKLSGSVNGQAFSTSGYLYHLLTEPARSRTGPQVKLNLAFPSLDLDAFLKNDKNIRGRDESGWLPENWSGELALNVETFSFGSFHAQKVNCALRYGGKKMLVHQLSMQAASGTFSGEGIIDGSDGKKLKVTADANINAMDLSRVFQLFGNFGQDYITHANLKGIVNSEFQCSFSMDGRMQIDPASLVANVEAGVENGELNNFSPVSKLGKFIRVDDLSQIRFSSLNNTIIIRDRTITIPSMEVKSNALDFTMSGTHTFDHHINYRFQVLLSDLLWRKAKKEKKENEEFGIVQDDNSGRTMLYILMTGTVDKPVFRYDSKGVKGKIVSSYLNEKTNLKQILKEEFSRKKTEQDTVSAKEELIRRQTEKGNFVIDWEGSLQDSLNKMKQRGTQERRKEKKKDEKQKFRVKWEEDEPVK